MQTDMVRLVGEKFFSTLPNRFVDCGPLTSEPSYRRGRNMMFYRKNVPGTERVIRLVAGVAMIACGLLGLKGLPIGYVIACVGVVSLLTGFVGYCPACAVAGRKTLP
jgi:Protein of unknown function (DUF2892)